MSDPKGDGLTLIDHVRVRTASTVDRLELCKIDSVGFLRTVAEEWYDWSSRDLGARSIFNWVAVYNFNVGPSAHALTLRVDAGSEALMLIKEGHVTRCDQGHRAPLVYVGFLEVAPWNKAAGVGRRYHGLGTIMLRVACDVSMHLGYGGRLGLHSLASAQDFYRRIGFRSLDCPNEYNEIYFEMDEHVAQELLRD